MPASTIYWIALIALGLCVLMSLLRRQTAARLAVAQRQLIDERKDRERAMSELLHVKTGRAAAEKEAEAAKKEASAAKQKLADLEAIESKLKAIEGERDAERSAKEDARASFEKAKDEANAELAALQTKLDALSGAGQEQARVAAEREKQLADLSSKLKEAEQAKALAAQAKKLTETRDAELASARERTKAVEAELAAAKERAKTIEADLSAAKEREKGLEEALASAKQTATVATPAPPTAAPANVATTDFLAALDADPYTNRGQKETIRMTYNQFTAKKRSS